MTEPADAAPSVVVVTVSYNSAEVLAGFLGSIAGASRALVPVVVSDNGSREVARIREVTAAYGAVLVAGDNVGYGSGVARSLAAAPPSKYVLISNPDVILGKGAIDALVAVAERRSDAAAVGPRILDASGRTYPSARALPSLGSGIGHALFSHLWPSNPWSRSYRDEDRTEEERTAGWLSGACLLVRRAAFDQVGGFDERYFMYFEDVDLGYRFGTMGWTNVYTPSAIVTHTGAHSTTHVARSMRREHHRSAYRFLARRYPEWYHFPIRLVTRIGLAVRLLTIRS